jgi:hypothetical protein
VYENNADIVGTAKVLAAGIIVQSNARRGCMLKAGERTYPKRLKRVFKSSVKSLLFRQWKK